MRAKSGLPTSVRGPIKTEELRYEPLKIKWHSEKGAYEVPIAFDVIEGVPFLVTVLSIERERYCKQNPDRSYVANFYTWKDEEIVPIQSDSVPLYRMRNNLSGLGPWGKYKQGDRTYLSIREIAQKSVRNADGSPAPLDVYFAKKKMFKCK
jgi:hypothetical protein